MVPAEHNNDVGVIAVAVELVLTNLKVCPNVIFDINYCGPVDRAVLFNLDRG
jgi:hypothetical protein